MITYKTTSIFDEDAEALVNTVNLVGVMGKGVALQFRELFPQNFKEYVKACKSKNMNIGKMFTTETGLITSPKFIINFPTKTDWRSQSHLQYIEQGLDDLVRVIQEKGITSIALPPLGCGNGGLNWSDVKHLLEQKLSQVASSVSITIFEPGHHAYTDKVLATEAPKLNKVRALVLALAEKYNVLDFDISHLEIQKLVYFMQEFGQTDFNLRFQKGHYGPYALNLKHLLAHLEGYYFKGQIRFQDLKPTDALYLVASHLPEVHQILEAELTAEEKERFKKLTAFIEGFESPFGMELLATVHWAVKELGKQSSAEQIVQYISRWSDRKKRMMTAPQIATAWERIRQYFV